MTRKRIPFSKEEKEQIISMLNSGTPYKEIANKLNRSVDSLRSFKYNLKKKTEAKSEGNKEFQTGKRGMPKKPYNCKSLDVASLDQFSYEEILVYLYQKGFRIENNQLVHYTCTPIKLDNII